MTFKARFILTCASLLVLALSSPAFADSLLGISLDNGNLYSISPTTASLTLVGNTGIDDWAEIQFAPDGILYGFTTSGSTESLYTINPNTAAATLVGSLGLPFVFEGGLAFSPDGTAYATNGNNANSAQLFTINLSTGAASVVGTISGGSHDINGLAYRSDGTLIGLDRVTNSLLLINPTTAAESTLAALAPTVGAVGGMTILNGVGYFDTAGPGATPPGSNGLYSFDLSTGSATSIGSFAPTITGTGISGLAASASQVPVPEPGTGVLMLIGLGALVLIRRNRLVC